MTKEKVDAWMPLWIGSYLADTMHLSTEQHGAYLLLLFAYWRNRGPLDDDDEDLANIVRAAPAAWKKLRPKIAKFFEVADGVWAHSRADRELAAAGIRKANAVSKAKAGAEARWGKSKEHTPSNASSDAPSIGEALQGHCPTPSPSPSESSDLRSGDAAAPPPVDKSTKTEDKRAAWRTCGAWMVENGIGEDLARTVMGKVIKDFPAVAIDAMVAAPKNGATPDPKAYLVATAQRLAGSRNTVPSDDAEKTKAYLAEQAAHSARVEAERLARLAVRAAEGQPS